VSSDVQELTKGFEQPMAIPGVSLTPLYGLLLFIALFTGFQGGRYYAGNIAQELGIFCSGLLFVIGAFTGLFHMQRREWNKWVFIPLILMVFIICTWGLVFAINFGGNPLYNIMASREFFFILLAPGIYLCGRSGLDLKSIERVVWLVLITSMLNYLLNYFRLDLSDAFFSGDHRISSLITYDEWRGFRLKPPLFAIMIAILAAFSLLVSKSGIGVKLFALIVIALSSYIWSIVLFRSTMATMLLSVFLYPLFFSRPNRVPFLMLVLPIAAIAAPIVLELLYQRFTGAEGGSVRLESYRLALSKIPERPFLGVGEDSAFGQTYASLFGPRFFPSDLGMVGITFKYGVIGLLMYLYAHFGILFKLCKTNWLVVQAQGRANPLVWALLIFFCAQTFNLVLNPGLAYAQGITVAAFSVALCGLIQHKMH